MLHGCEPINKESNDCLSSDMEALFPLDHLETRTVVSTAEHAQLVCKLCVTGLPIEQIVAYAVGTFVTCILSYLSLKYQCARVLVSGIFMHIREGLESVISFIHPRPKSVTNSNILFASRNRKGHFVI